MAIGGAGNEELENESRGESRTWNVERKKEGRGGGKSRCAMRSRIGAGAYQRRASLAVGSRILGYSDTRIAIIRSRDRRDRAARQIEKSTDKRQFWCALRVEQRYRPTTFQQQLHTLSVPPNDNVRSRPSFSLCISFPSRKEDRSSRSRFAT